MKINSNLILTPTCLFIFAIVLILVWFWSRRHFYKFALNFPTCWGVPIFGIMPQVKHPDNLFYYFDKIFKEKNSDSVLGWCGLYPTIITKDVDFINFLLAGREFLEKPHRIYHSANVALHNGMITSSEKVWSSVRPLMEPSFRRDVFLSLFPLINIHKSQLIEKLDPLSNGKKQKLVKVIHESLLKLTMETTMGSRAAKDEKVYKEFVYNLSEAMKSIPIKIFAGCVNLDWLFSFYKWNEIEKAQKFIHNVIKDWLNEKVQTEIDDDGLPSNIFIKNAIKLYQNNRLSWEQMKGETYTVFTAAFETTASAVFSTLVLLAMHTDVQEKVYEELKNVLGDPKRDISYEDYSKLPYLDIVLKEVMRVVPSVPLIGRQIKKNTPYKNWNTVIPKDVQVIISIFNLSRHTGIWGPDADEFRPSRFLEENLTLEQRKAYIPFSKGYRNCIGYRYAQFTLKIITAGILFNYKFETDFKYKDLKFAENVSIRYWVEPFLMFTKRAA